MVSDIITITIIFLFGLLAGVWLVVWWDGRTIKKEIRRPNG